MKRFIARWGGKATASLSWGKNGTLRGSVFGGTQYPVLLEAGANPLRYVNTNTVYAHSITHSGPVFPRVQGSITGSSSVAAATFTVTLPSFVAGDRLILFSSSSQGGTGMIVSTAGWTELATLSGLSAIYRDMDGTEGSTISLDTLSGGNTRIAWLIYNIAAGTFDPAQAPEIDASVTAGNNPPSLTASWGSDNNLFFAANAREDVLTSVTYPYADGQLSATSSVAISQHSILACYSAVAAATEDPGAFTISPAATHRVGTLVVRGFTPSSGATITPSLHTNTQTFFGPTIRRTMKPGAYSNAQAFFTQSIRRTLRPTAYTDADTINAHSIRRTIRPGLYSDPDTINAQSIVTGNTVAPAAFTNAQAFYSPRIRVTLKPGLYADPDTFHAPTVSLNRLVNPALFTNAQVFRVHTIRVTLKPAALTSTTTVPSPAIRRGINPALFVNAPTFRTQTVQAPYAVQPAKHFNSQAFQVTRVIGPPTPFSGLSGLYTTGFIQYKAPKVKKQDLPRGFLLPPPEGIPEPAKIQQVRAYPLRKGELKGRTVLVNQPPPGAKPAQTDALDLILAALLLGRPNDGA